jgi:DNA-binding CsgD family transcriptional regulator
VRAVTLDRLGAFVRTHQVQQLYRVFAETREIAGAQSPLTARQHAIARLCELLGCVTAALVVDDDHRPGRPGRLTRVVVHGPTDDRAFLQMVQEHLTHGPTVDPACARIVEHRGLVITGTRQDLVDDRDWYRDRFVADYLNRANLDHALYSKRSAQREGCVYGLVVNRASNDRPFTEEDRNLVHLFQLEAEWLHRLGESHDVGDLLSPRARETLRHLLTGASEKAIAAAMGLSVHTVHDYVKRLYRHFHVGSRAELLVTLRGREADVASGMDGEPTRQDPSPDEASGEVGSRSRIRLARCDGPRKKTQSR